MFEQPLKAEEDNSLRSKRKKINKTKEQPKLEISGQKQATKKAQIGSVAADNDKE